jgi:hypothetical protein
MSAAEHTRPEAENDLAKSLRELTDRIEALQADVRRLGGPSLPTGDAGWDDDRPALSADPVPSAAPESSYAWVGALEPRVRRRPTVPRLLLESLFLVGVAVGCGLAKLDAAVIAAVMGGAWALVALIEWTSARADARRDDIVVTFATRPEAEPDPSWLVPPVERTLLDAGDVDATAVTRLPPPPDDGPEPAPEHDDELTQH